MFIIIVFDWGFTRNPEWPHRQGSGLRTAERRKVNVLEMKCLRSLVGVSRMERVRNEEVRRRTVIERELASRVHQRVL